MSSIDPNAEFMIELSDAWARHFSHNYSSMPGHKLFYKFARYLRYEFDDADIIKEIDKVIPDHFPDFLDYLVGR